VVPPPAPTACAGAIAHGPLNWFEDDYARALACAKDQRKPLLLDMWAPWCHTCVAMKTMVLNDPSLAPLAERFVFVAIDTDKPSSAAVVAQFPLQNWPTFFVVDPITQAVQSRWLGAASIGQFRQLLKDGEAAFLANQGGAALDPLLAGVRTGDQAANQKDWNAARAAWAAVLKDAPPHWPRRSDVLVSLVSATFKSGAHTECLQLVTSSIGQTGATANAADFVAWGLECANAAGVDPSLAQAARQAAVDRLSALVDEESAPLSADDRSDAMMNLRNAYDALGQKDAARAVAERQLGFLTAAAAKATDPFARMTFNWPRTEVHVYLGRGAELVPALIQSAQDLPNEYDPPYRLAWVYMKMGAPDQALAPAKRAANKAYGTRKVRVQGFVVEAAKALGDRAEENAARQALIAVLEGLPKEAAQPEALAKAKAELAAMDAAAEPQAPAPPAVPPGR
jgi:thiol-disulfide isomerase/thioredoxin